MSDFFATAILPLPCHVFQRDRFILKGTIYFSARFCRESCMRKWARIATCKLPYSRIVCTSLLFMRRLLLLLSFLSLPLVSCSTFSKKEKVLITVFSQGNDMDSPKSVFRRNLEGKEVILKVIPEFTHKSIVAFHAFPANDGSYGVALKLDFKGSNALEMVTRTHQGELLVSMVNGAVVDYVTIDNRVADGVFTIWRGLPEELIGIMDKEFPRIQALNSANKGTPFDTMDMLPSTSVEKSESHDRVKEAAKDEAKSKKKKKGDENDPELPDGAVIPLSEALDESR